MPARNTLQQLLALVEDYHDFNPDHVPICPWPSAVDFSKQVNKGTPCLFELPAHLSGTPPSDVLSDVGTDGTSQNGSSHTSPGPWRAHRWTREYLIDRVKEPVEVAVTPNGRADALHDHGDNNDKVFLQPATVLMSMSKLLDKLSTSITSPSNNCDTVYYLQSQNSNLTTTPLKPLLDDLPTNLSFASPVLGEPEAINIWIGDARSVTSTHRDPYENLYVVLNGNKTFTLYPPIEEICMDSQLVRTGSYVYHHHPSEEATSSSSTSQKFTITLDEAAPSSEEEDRPDVGDGPAPPPPRIPWVPIDPSQPKNTLTSQHPLYAHARPLTVTVDSSHILYLPAGWYHHVTQAPGVWSSGNDSNGETSPCIAVNYWYDQEYEGEKYVMRQMMGRMVERAKEEMKC